MLCAVPSVPTFNVLLWTALPITLLLLARVIQYMMATFTTNERAKTLALLALKDVVGVLILAVVALNIPSVVEILAKEFGYGDWEALLTHTPSFVNTTIDYLREVGENSIITYAHMAYLSSLSFDSRITVPVPFVHPTLSASIKYPSVKLLVPYVEELIGYIYNLMGALITTRDILCFSSIVAYYYLLPLGLILRATGFLKRLGSTLVSIGIAVGVFLPPFNAIVGSLLGYFFSLPPAFLSTSPFTPQVAQAYALITSVVSTDVILSFITSLTDILNLSTFGIWEFIYQGALLVKTILSILLNSLAPIVGAGLSESSEALMDEVMVALSSLASIILITTLYIFALVFFALGLTRALSIHLGGEFFLYRVQDYV